MVRINIIEPRLLSDQHLIAEYHEIGMLLGYVRKHRKINDIPEKYTLNKGHMKFFKNKLGYLKTRSNQMIKEMKARGFKVKKLFNFKIYSPEHMGTWRPTVEDYEVIKPRISQRLKRRPTWYRYYGERVNVDWLIEQMS